VVICKNPLVNFIVNLCSKMTFRDPPYECPLKSFALQLEFFTIAVLSVLWSRSCCPIVALFSHFWTVTLLTTTIFAHEGVLNSKMISWLWTKYFFTMKILFFSHQRCRLLLMQMWYVCFPIVLRHVLEVTTGSSVLLEDLPAQDAWAYFTFLWSKLKFE